MARERVVSATTGASMNHSGSTSRAVTRLVASAALALALSMPRTTAAKGPVLEVAPIQLKVVIVSDPDFPPIAPAFAKRALGVASRELAGRFGIAPPELELAGEMSLSAFLGKYAVATDPRCQAMYAARYQGRGASELLPHRGAALGFLERWSLESLQGFIDESERASLRSHEDVYAQYVTKYVATVERMKSLKTPAGTPLVEPERSQLRSFVAWTCALLRQSEYDVVLTNTFILADLLTEPHPHAVFGKAKIGGIAGRSPERSALGGQALLATTFGIDTKLRELAELPGAPATEDEREKILGLYILAHEIAHAVFGIPDVFDHPPGCIMTSRPGSNYREGLIELEAHPEPCPKCWTYVEARAALDRAEQLLLAGEWRQAISSATRSADRLPKHFHGGRKRRMAQALSIAARALRELGKEEKARAYAVAARDLDPGSEDVLRLFEPASRTVSVRDLDLTTTSTRTR